LETEAYIVISFPVFQEIISCRWFFESQAFPDDISRTTVSLFAKIREHGIIFLGNRDLYRHFFPCFSGNHLLQMVFREPGLSG
jgi:hypothetical protein